MKITEFLFIACFSACVVPAYHAAPSFKVPCMRSTNCNMQQHIGCYVMDGICRCAQEVCCESPFNYTSLESCRAENKVIMEDPCKQAPCKHNGYCVQLRGSAAYRCECEGTGYFGPRCHEKCPKNPGKAMYRLRESKARFVRRRVFYMLACLL